KLINLAVPDTIDERALNKRDSLNVYQKTENNNLAVNAAKTIGCQVINIGAQDLIEGRPVLILGLLWQIIKIQLTSQISLKNYPELVLLLSEGEEMSALSALPPEDILLRWFNYHLKSGGSSRHVSNFGDDLKDSECYSVLLHQLDASNCDLCTESDPMDKAAHVISNAVKLGAYPFIRAEDICAANKKLNLGFVALLFNTCHGLTLSEEIIANFDFASLTLDDAGDTREERVFRMWINSLNMPGVYIHNLFDDLSDGFVILQLEDSVQPGVVNWKKANKDPKSVYKKVENCNYAVEIGRSMGFSMVNIGGLDIVHKDKKLILAIIWQLMRRHTLKVLAALAAHEGLTEVTEEHIIHWANSRVARSGKTSTMQNFKDHSLKTGVFLLDLVAAVEPRAVNWDLVTTGENDDDQLSNAKYCISVSQKIGACVFLTPEDIVEVKSKMIMTFVSSIWATDLSMQR
ncbi:FIM3, partial [Symbiodinium microadriaticum]